MEIVLSSASHHAMLFAYVTQEVIGAFGADGRETIIRAVRLYGRQRGQRMAMRARIDGNPIDAFSYNLYSEWECFPGQVECVSSLEGGSFCIHYSRCPWHTEWTHLDMLEYGRCYCDYVDEAIMEGFGVTDGVLAGSRADGHATCDLRFSGKTYTREALERFEAKKLLLGERAKMPWEYHVGHLYRTLRDCIEERFGREGRRALNRALKNYGIQFGDNAKKLVLEYADLDYTKLPPYSPCREIKSPLAHIDRLVETDVLVAGGSSAAVAAAVAAAERGLDVTVLSKGKIGSSGNLLMAGGGFSLDGYSARHELGLETDDPSTGEDMLDRLIKEGFYLNDQDLTALYAEEGPASARQLLDWADAAGQEYVFLPDGTCTASGKSFTPALEQGMREHPEIRRMEDCMITEVLTNSRQVTGALALDLSRGEILLIRAKAVILATGGYQPFQNSNTVSDMTGDGQAIACRAGAELVNMEFFLGMPTALEPAAAQSSGYPFVFDFNFPDLRYRLLDRNFQPLELPQEAAKCFRDKRLSKLANSYLFFQAQENGTLTDRGGLYLDYSENDREKRRESLERFYQRFSPWHRLGYYNRELLSGMEDAVLNGRPLEVTLDYTYSMGGVQVDTQMRTAVQGLFAAGEVTSGTFGACRTEDSILEMLVQGRRAGSAAANFCERRDFRELDPQQLRSCLERHLHCLNRQDGVSPLLLFEQIQQICRAGFGLVRSEGGLKAALDELERLRLQLDELCCTHSRERIYNLEWLRAFQCENLLLCCEAGIRAALERRESRGCHMRADYPQVDHDHFLVKYLFRCQDGRLAMSAQKPRADRRHLPAGKSDSIITYLTASGLAQQDGSEKRGPD